MNYPARQYSGAGLATTLTTSLSATSTTIGVANASTWTNAVNRASLVGTSGTYFTIIIDYGTVNEEKIQCSGLTNTSITVDTGGRGLDSTGPSAGVGLAHTTGASVMLCLSATEMAEINGTIQATVGNVAAIGDLIQGNGVNSFGRLPAGAAGTALTSNGSGLALSWSTIATPSGALLDYAGGTVPSGFLACDGTAVSRSTYAALFAAIGTNWGAGNGTTTFNVPDLRGRATIGAGTGTGRTARTLAVVSGTETVTLTSAQSGMPSHNHTDSGHSHVQTGYYGGIGSGSGFGLGTLASPSSAGSTFSNTNNASANISYTSADASSAHDNMQPSAVVTKIIKY